MYDESKLLEIINNLCEFKRVSDRLTVEEIIADLVDAGANRHILHELGYTDGDIDNYIYYMQQISDMDESGILDYVGR